MAIAHFTHQTHMTDLYVFQYLKKAMVKMMGKYIMIASVFS